MAAAQADATCLDDTPSRAQSGHLSWLASLVC